VNYGARFLVNRRRTNMKPNKSENVRACSQILLTALLVVGCQQYRPDDTGIPETPRPESAAMKPKVDSVPRFEQILEMLWDKDEKVRESGMKNLTDFQKDTKEPGSTVGLMALRTAARAYPFEKPEPGRVSAELVAVAYGTPLPEYIPVVVELFDRFSDDAKWRAQIILTKLESRQAAEAFMSIVRTHAPTGKLPSLIVSRLVNKPRYPDVFFPEILKYAANPKLSFEVYRLCLAYCEADLLPADKLAPFTDQVLKSYSDLAAKLHPAQRDQGVGWMWEDAYEESRNDAALLLDLLGHFPGNRVEKALRDALEYKDPRLKHFAIVSLLRLGKPVEKKHVEDVAHHAEMRNWLYVALRRLGKSSLFPETYRTQKAFAEANMVNWLVYPTELNRVPDEIELMKVVTVDTGLPGGIYDYYLFRFRTNEPHWAAKNGWIAGVSGPYLRKDQPTTDALGDTFSSFAKWDAKTPDEHVGDIRELMQKWRDYHLKKKD
jgi:hypothetical protein